MKLSRWVIIVGFVLAFLLAALPACRVKKQTTQNLPQSDEPVSQSGEPVSSSSGPVLIEFDILLDMELPYLTPFSEPAQFAIWLEEPESGRLQTVFVTYRSATGDWVGTAERPGSLPRWFEVFREEMKSTGLPTFDNSAPDAVTGATPQSEQFKTSVSVKGGGQWICWIEVNLAGDFNAKYQEQNEKEKTVDWDFVGQPALVYRGQIKAVPGEHIVPELYGESGLDNPDGKTIQPISDGVTTAKNIFKAIKISVVGTDE